MLRIQPFALVRRDSHHHVLRCQANNQVVEFVFTVDDGEGELGTIERQDAYYFVSYDDGGELGVSRAVSCFHGFKSRSETIFDLPAMNCFPIKLEFVQSEVDGSRKYVIAFENGRRNNRSDVCRQWCREATRR